MQKFIAKVGALCFFVWGMSVVFSRAADVSIPASFAVPASSVDKSKAGFNVQMHQLESGRPGGGVASAVLRQLNGDIIDPSTSQAVANVIDNTGATYPTEAGKWSGFVFREEGVINYNQDSRDNPDAGAGNFRPDKPLPGIPGIGVGNDNIAMRATTFLELKKGTYRMGVNSDDGFQVSTAVNPLDAAALTVGTFNADRGFGDTLFSFVVEADGFYPFTLIWWETGGGAGVEWFSFDGESGQRILINDPANAKSIKAYRESTFNPPYVKSVSPDQNSYGVAVNVNIQFVLVDATSKVVGTSIQATVNGATVKPTVNKVGAETTVVIDPVTDLPAGSKNDVSLSYSNDATPPVTRTVNISFTTDRGAITLQPVRQSDLGLVVIEAEKFDARTTAGGHFWSFAPTPGGFGGDGAMYALPDSGAGPGLPDAITTSPRLDYKVNFVKTGKHYFWFRGSDGGGNSLHAGIDEVDPTGTTLDNMDDNCCGTRSVGGTSWVWVGGIDGTPEGRSAFEVPSAGVHTIHLWMREDGQLVDRILITTDPNFVPGGVGSAESRRVGDPFLPLVKLTAPVDGATFTLGSSVTLTAEANDPDGTVTKIEFFEGDNKIGEDTSTPFSITWKPSEEKGYRLSAKVTDNSGETNTSTAAAAPVRIIYGNPPKVLFAGNNPDTNAGDQVIIKRLENRGFLVTTVDDNATDPSDADGKTLIVISSTVSSGNVGDKYTQAPIPIINWEEALMDNLIMTGDSGADPDHHGSTGGLTAINIVKADHPLAAGLSAGVHQVYSSPATMSWGYPELAANAIVIATVAGSTNQAAIFAYEKGATLFDGATKAPARRVGFFLNGGSTTVLTDEGIKLVDAAINWALDIKVTEPPKMAASRSGANLTISWTGSGALQQADSVTGPWGPAPSQTNPQTVSITGAARFYRIRQ